MKYIYLDKNARPTCNNISGLHHDYYSSLNKQVKESKVAPILEPQKKNITTSIMEHNRELILGEY